MLKRITFEIYKNGSPFRDYTLIINPEEISVEENSRTTINKTLESYIIEEWGLDLPVYNISGVTGYRASDGKTVIAETALKELRDNIYKYFLEPDGKKKQTIKDKYELYYHDWTLSEHFLIYPTKFRLSRSKSRPLLYAYEITFVVLKNVVDVQENSKIDDVNIRYEELHTQTYNNVTAVFGSLNQLKTIAAKVGISLTNTTKAVEIFNNIFYEYYNEGKSLSKQTLNTLITTINNEMDNLYTIANNTKNIENKAVVYENIMLLKEITTAAQTMINKYPYNLRS